MRLLGLRVWLLLWLFLEGRSGVLELRRERGRVAWFYIFFFGCLRLGCWFCGLVGGVVGCEDTDVGEVLDMF